MVDPSALQVVVENRECVPFYLTNATIVTAGQESTFDWVRCGAKNCAIMDLRSEVRLISVDDVNAAIAEREEALVANPVRCGRTRTEHQAPSIRVNSRCHAAHAANARSSSA
jgi:hypothetical protein